MFRLCPVALSTIVHSCASVTLRRPNAWARDRASSLVNTFSIWPWTYFSSRVRDSEIIGSRICAQNSLSPCFPMAKDMISLIAAAFSMAAEEANSIARFLAKNYWKVAMNFALSAWFLERVLYKAKSARISST